MNNEPSEVPGEGQQSRNPIPNKTLVRKRDGHEFEGYFLCEYEDMKGRVWWMVELHTSGANGLMFHFRKEQMEVIDYQPPVDTLREASDER